MDRLPPELHQQVADKLNSGGLDIDVNRTISVSSRGKPFAPVVGNNSAASEDTSALGTADMSSSNADLGTMNQSPITRYDGNSPAQYDKEFGRRHYPILACGGHRCRNDLSIPASPLMHHSGLPISQ